MALDVERIRFGQHPNKVRMVLDVSDVTDFRVFALSSPYRIVIDLPTFQWKAGRVNKPQHTLISDIRQGALMPDISRIVFDLKQPAIVQSAFLLPQQGKQKNRIVIDYAPASAAQFNAHKGTIHGTLTVDDTAKTKPQRDDTPRPPKNAARPSTVQRDKPLIIIDPGHGGVDPGTVGHHKIYEKHIVFPMAHTLKKELLASGKYRVLMTREKDVFVRLNNRVKFARQHKGDLFISLHANSIHKPHVRGASVYTLSKKASDAQTAKLAEKENQADLMANVDFEVEDEQVAFILGDFLMNDTMNQAKFLANTLVSKFNAHGIRTLPNPHRYAGFAVLKAPDIPSILVEAGFVSNKTEANLLRKSAHRQKIVKAIRASIDAYFDNIYKNESN